MKWTASSKADRCWHPPRLQLANALFYAQANDVIKQALVSENLQDVVREIEDRHVVKLATAS